MLVLVVNLLNGLLNEVIEGDVVFPAPVIERLVVVKGARPCLGDGLSEIRGILDGEIGDEPKKEDYYWLFIPYFLTEAAICSGEKLMPARL